MNIEENCFIQYFCYPTSIDFITESFCIFEVMKLNINPKFYFYYRETELSLSGILKLN